MEVLPYSLGSHRKLLSLSLLMDENNEVHSPNCYWKTSSNHESNQAQNEANTEVRSIEMEKTQVMETSLHQSSLKFTLLHYCLLSELNDFLIASASLY